jgi:hypothetical protein
VDGAIRGDLHSSVHPVRVSDRLHFFGEIGMPVLYFTLAPLAMNAVGHLIQRERMQHYGYVPQAPSGAEAPPDDPGGRLLT